VGTLKSPENQGENRWPKNLLRGLGRVQDEKPGKKKEDRGQLLVTKATGHQEINREVK